MKRLIHNPTKTIGKLKLETETGPRYQVVSVMLKDGRRFDQVVTSEGCIIEVRGYAQVPFTCHEVASQTVTPELEFQNAVGKWKVQEPGCICLRRLSC